MININELMVTLLFFFAGLLFLGLLGVFCKYTKIGRSFIIWVGKKIFYTDLEDAFDDNDDEYFEDDDEEDYTKSFFSLNK